MCLFEFIRVEGGGRHLWNILKGSGSHKSLVTSELYTHNWTCHADGLETRFRINLNVRYNSHHSEFPKVHCELNLIQFVSELKPTFELVHAGNAVVIDSWYTDVFKCKRLLFQESDRVGVVKCDVKAWDLSVRQLC
jgi:hypothetical protein